MEEEKKIIEKKMKILTFLFIGIGIYLIVASFHAAFVYAQDSLPRCGLFDKYDNSISIEDCLSSEDIKTLVVRKTMEDVVIYSVVGQDNVIRLFNSKNEALQEYNNVISETQKDFQRNLRGSLDRIDTQNLSVGSQGTLLYAMQGIPFFDFVNIPVREEDMKLEGLGRTFLPERSKTVFVQDNCLVYFNGSVYLNRYMINFKKYHEAKKIPYEQYWKLSNNHPNFDHGKQYFIDQSIELARILSKNIKGKCGRAAQKKNDSQTQNPVYNQPSSNTQPSQDLSKAAQAFVVEVPQANDFKKVKLSDFKIIYPVSTSSAAVKLATQSANIEDSIFIGKIGGDGKLVVDLPSEENVNLNDDMTGTYGKTYNFRLHLSDIPSDPYKPVSLDVVTKYISCEQQLRPMIEYMRSGVYRASSDWGWGTYIEKNILEEGCSYINESGATRILVEKGTETILTPSGVSVSANKADFGIAYDAKSALSIVEIYNGSVTVTNKAGQAKKISTVYGSQINRIEVNKDGVMTEKIAIPLSKWEAFLASQQKETEGGTSRNALPVLVVIIVLGMGGAVFFLYRKGKLMPLYKTLRQKISGMTKKISKNNKQQDSA